MNIVRSEDKYNGPLFKYMGNLDYAEAAIENQNIYLASPSTFNDPFDCAVSFNAENVKEIIALDSVFLDKFKVVLLELAFNDFKEIPIGEGYSTLEEFCQLLSNHLHPKVKTDTLLLAFCDKYRLFSNLHHSDGFKVSCFSKTNQSIPMWAYYASSHAGVCLEYDLSLLDNSKHYGELLLNSIHNVDYSNSFNLHDIRNPVLSFQKSKQWAHEKECRIVCETNNDFIDFPCLSSVYIGVKVTREDREKFVKLSQKHGLKCYLGRSNTSQFKIDFVDFEKYSTDLQVQNSKRRMDKIFQSVCT